MRQERDARRCLHVIVDGCYSEKSRWIIGTSQASKPKTGKHRVAA